jgi:DNA-binding response OmpR family regulator
VLRNGQGEQMLSRRVLIIEDDADAAGVLEAYLRRENYDVAVPWMAFPGWIWRSAGNPI